MKKLVIVLTVFVFMGFGLALSPGVWADPITGEELSNSFNANSTNALNYASSAPTRVGQLAPFVLFDSNDAGHVTLQFNNPSVVKAYFEYRVDGAASQYGNIYPHPIVPNDYYYYYYSFDAGSAPVLKTFAASQMVEIRSAFGAEQDWYFDWTAFRVASVPEPATMLLLGLGLMGIAGIRRKFKG